MNSRPLLAAPGFAEAVVAASKQNFKTPNLDSGNSSQTAAVLPVVAGIAVIDVAGVILHRTGQLHPTYGATGLDGLQVKLQTALNDDAIRGVLLNINSGGGQVSGVFDMADMLREARADRPVWALIDETAASAAYTLASAADKIIMPRTAQAGSIGVVLPHLDQSGALEQAGLRVSLIHAGQHKVDGHSFAPLSDSVRADLQREVDGIYGLFTRTVARNRGIDEGRVRSTEARIYTGEDAVSAGLVDEIMASRHVLAAFDDHLRGRRTRTTRTTAASPERSIGDLAASYWPAETSKLNARSAHRLYEDLSQ